MEQSQRIIKLENEVVHIKEDISEIKEDKKEMNRILNSLDRNVIKMTSIVENQDKRLTLQDKKMDDHHESLNKEISYLRQDMNKHVEMNVKWYQSFLSGTFGTVIKGLVIIILVLLGYKLTGADIAPLLK